MSNRDMTKEEQELFNILDAWYGRLDKYSSAATASLLFNQLLPHIRAHYNLKPKSQEDTANE